MVVWDYLFWWWCIVATITIQLCNNSNNCFVNADCELESVRLLHEADPAWTPNAILDIVANVGCWTIRGRQLFPNTKFMMFEAFQNFSIPLAKVRDDINNKDMVDFAIDVLSSDDGDEVKFWAEGATGNSMFPQLLGRYHGRGHADIKPVTRITKTLDTARQTSFLRDERIDILKLDVQGAELSVLKGASDILKEVTFVQFEASVIEYNKGGSCYFQVDEYLREHGFFLYDMGDMQRNLGLFKSNGVGQYDSIYLRPSSEYIPESIKNLGPNLCGSNNFKNLKFPLGSNTTTATSLESATNTPNDTSRGGKSSNVTYHRPNIGMLFLGILIGRFLLPRRAGMQKKRMN